MKLNDKQLEAVNSNDRFIFLLAGAGSGKTRVIVERIKRLVNEGKNPNEILAITFTNKAASEMRERINNSSINVNTFHAFCYQELEKTGFNIRVIDPKDTPFTQFELLQVSRYKNSLSSVKPPLIFYEYNAYLTNKKVYDFDDLMLMFLNSKEYFSKFKYVFIDEFQDTNPLQYQILNKLIKKDSSVFCVGDPDQSIYAFRGANSKIINTFIKDFKATLITLDQNYRSSKLIINAANFLIKKNKNRINKKLEHVKQEDGIIEFYQFENYQAETKFIIEKLKELLSEGILFKDIAIIYRNHNRAVTFKKKYYNNYLYQIKPELNLLSCHESKGLEFKVVFIIGLENNLFPSIFENKISELEEERRLMYVAMTRAMERLYITISENDQNLIKKKPSLFITELSPKISKIS